MTETLTRSEFELLEAAHGQTRRDLADLAGKVDDNHADAMERIDQLRSDLHRAAGTSDRRLKAVEKTQREILDHLGFLTGKVTDLTGKVTEHDARFDRIEGKLTEHDARFDRVEGKLDEVLRRLPAAD